MCNLANSEDPDEIPINDLHCCLQHRSSEKQIQCFRNITCKLSIYTMDYPKFIFKPEVESRISAYEGCSNMNASSFITFFTYMLRQNVIPFWKELVVAFKMAPNIKKHSLYFSSYRPLYKWHYCILKFFWSKLQCTFWYICGYSVISL